VANQGPMPPATAAPPDIETQNTPVTGALQEPQMDQQPINLQQPGAAPTPPARHPVMDRVANFVTGGQQTPGAMWRGIIGGALTGMVAGAGQRHFGTGVAAGGGAAAQQRQQQFENQLQVTREQQEQQVRAAQIAKANHDIWESTQRLQMAQTEASIRHAQAENEFVQGAMNLSGDSKDLGAFKGQGGVLSDAEIAQIRQAHPEFGKDMARGNIFAVPHFREETDPKTGSTRQIYDGVHAVYIPPNVANQKTDHDINIPQFVPGKKADEAGHWDEQTIKAGSMTNAQAFAAQQAAQGLAAKYDNDKIVADANAKLAMAQAKLAKGAQDQADAQTQIQNANLLGRDLVERDAAPVNLPKRASAKQKDSYNAMLAAADAYSMAHYGKHYDIAKADADFKEAGQVRNTFEFMNSLTGVGGQGGTLQQLLSLSAKLPRTDFPALNDAIAWGRLETGNPTMAAYHVLMTEVADQVGKVLQGGGPGAATTDTKLKQAQKMFDTGFSNDSLIEVAKTMNEALNTRKNSLLQANGYLQKWFGPNSDLVKNATQNQAQGVLPGGTAENPMGL
jgi:hypothetical protein